MLWRRTTWLTTTCDMSKHCHHNKVMSHKILLVNNGNFLFQISSGCCIMFSLSFWNRDIIFVFIPKLWVIWCILHCGKKYIFLYIYINNEKPIISQSVLEVCQRTKFQLPLSNCTNQIIHCVTSDTSWNSRQVSKEINKMQKKDRVTH